MDLAAVTQRVKVASGAWARAGLGLRLTVLEDASRRLADATPALREAVVRDGASETLARAQVGRILHITHAGRLRWHARDLARLVRSRWGNEILAYRPDGVLLVVAPGNSPTSAMMPVFYMLLVGNGVVVRAPRRNKVVGVIAEALQSALSAHGFANVLEIVDGSAREVIGQLVPGPDIATVVFFGNSVAAREVVALAGQHRKKVIVELEGGDHMLVWKDAALSAALDSAMHVWDASNQLCVLPKHLLVHAEVYERFLTELVARTRTRVRTTIEDPGRGVLSEVGKVAEFDVFLEEAARGGAKVECGGYRIGADGKRDAAGKYAAPTVLSINADALLGKKFRCFDEELAFPLVPVVRFDGTDEAIECAMFDTIRRSPFGLRCSLWTQDAELMGRFVRENDDVGMLRVNEDHLHPSALGLAWGGPKRSGGPAGENMLWAQRTGHLQSITCKNLSDSELDAVLRALGHLSSPGSRDDSRRPPLASGADR